MPKKANEDDNVDLEKLAKVMDFIKSGEFQKIVQDFMANRCSCSDYLTRANPVLTR